MSQSSVMDNGAKDSRAHPYLGKNRRERIVLPSYLYLSLLFSLLSTSIPCTPGIPLISTEGESGPVRSLPHHPTVYTVMR